MKSLAISVRNNAFLVHVNLFYNIIEFELKPKNTVLLQKIIERSDQRGWMGGWNS